MSVKTIGSDLGVTGFYLSKRDQTKLGWLKQNLPSKL